MTGVLFDLSAGSFYIQPDGFPEYGLVHDPDAILPGLFGLSRLCVGVGQYKKIELLGYRVRHNESGPCGELLGQLS